MLQVEDLYGDALYRALDLEPGANEEDIKRVRCVATLTLLLLPHSVAITRKPSLSQSVLTIAMLCSYLCHSFQAYRQLAKVHHPDKGGDARIFGQLRHAYEVLSDAKRRQVYDTWAKELQFKVVRPNGSQVRACFLPCGCSHSFQSKEQTCPTCVPLQAMGGEDVLLNELDALGLVCDPGSQLVVTCEVCRRPATKECWTCGMQICEFCTLKRHWRDGVPLHWPLINSDHMKERLAKRELEKKRIDDANRLALEDPNYRNDKELQDIRDFKQAAHKVSQLVTRHTTYDLRLAKFYMWAQTDRTVYLACRVPTGYGDRELFVECTGTALIIQPEKSPPLIDRFLAHNIDLAAPIENLR